MQTEVRPSTFLNTAVVHQNITVVVDTTSINSWAAYVICALSYMQDGRSKQKQDIVLYTS